MSNIDFAKGLLGEAEARVDAAGSQLRKRRYAYVVRQSQEAVELSLKSCLRLAGIEFPKEHEVSRVLADKSERYPGWFSGRIPEMARVSRELVQKRIPSMYGDETGKGPGELFTREDATRALTDAKMVFSMAGRLLRIWSRETLRTPQKGKKFKTSLPGFNYKQDSHEASRYLFKSTSTNPRLHKPPRFVACLNFKEAAVPPSWTCRLLQLK